MAGSTEPKCVLIVDNHQLIRAMVKSFLETESGSCICVEAVDGPEAIQKTEEIKPDLIILEFALPRLNGIETARILKKKLPQTPIVLFTLFHDALESFDMRGAGIDAVIPKAGDIFVLHSRIQELLHQVR